MPADLVGHVAVITGASSGIARQAALDFAAAGASVVAASRNERGLATLADEARSLPGTVLTVPLDVADAASVQAVADRAVDAFGRIDTWANVAAVFLLAEVERTPAEDLRRLLEVNVVGVLHGMHAALPVMRRQGSGTIINVASVDAWRALPLQGAYSASKHAVKALTEAARVELRREGVPVRLCLVSPAAVNTPFWRHARVRTGSRHRPPPPVYQPEAVSSALVRLASHPVDRVTVGLGGKVLEVSERLVPSVADRVMESPYGFESQVLANGSSPDAPGGADEVVDNFEAPLDEPGETRGEFDRGAQGRSWYTDLVALHPVRTRLVGLGAAAAAGAWLWRRR